VWSLFHKIGAVVGPVAALLPEFTGYLGTGISGKITAVAGVLVTLFVNLPKAFAPSAPSASSSSRP
jgi:hypothetical protein